ncbi:RNA-directed DNA polymerase, eukaryota [Tanacetum coccineum]
MGTDEWQEVSRRKRYNNTKEDDLIKISISIYVTNFPESFLAKDLFHACSKYGHVVDSFIPWKKSKEAKGTNRNSNVSSKDVRPAAAAKVMGRNGSYNISVQKRESFASVLNSKPNGSGNMETGMGHQVPNIAQTSSHSSSALVLDDSCVIECDLTCYATGKVKAIESIQNLRNILYNEGFPKVKLTYLGGLWVMIELVSEEMKNSLLSHVGVNSWFEVLQEASCDFVSDERVVWIDLEGVPLNLWSKETFSRIGRKWGLIQDIEAKQGVSFACKRLCLLTKHPVSILEQFKIIYKGKVSWVRAKELFTWVPIFSDINIDESDKDSTQDNLDQFEMQNPHHAEGDVDSDVERDVEGVAETIFSEQSASFNASSKINTGVQKSADPFGLYELLNKQKKVRDDDGASSQSQSHPPGFTPVDCQVSKEDNVNNVTEDVDDGVGSAEEGECPPSMNAKLTIGVVSDSDMGDGNEVRWMRKGRFLPFNTLGARRFNEFIMSAGLVFDDMVEKAWRSVSYTDSNAMVRFKKMLQELKSLIRAWVKERKADQSGSRNIIWNISLARPISLNRSGLPSCPRRFLLLAWSPSIQKSISDTQSSASLSKGKLLTGLLWDVMKSFWLGQCVMRISKYLDSARASRGVLDVAHTIMVFEEGFVAMVPLSVAHLFMQIRHVHGEWSQANLGKCYQKAPLVFKRICVSINIQKVICWCVVGRSEIDQQPIYSVSGYE